MAPPAAPRVVIVDDYSGLPIFGTGSAGGSGGAPGNVVDVARSTPVVVSGTAAAINALAIPVTEVFGTWVSVQLTGTYSGVLTFEGSNDSVSWAPLALTRTDTITPIPLAATANLNFIWHGPVPTRYFRARCSIYISGSIDAIAVFSAVPAALNSMEVDTELPAATVMGDGFSGSSVIPNLGAFTLVYNGATWDRVRTATVFKPQNAVAIATEATVWTPAASKKFRLMGGMITSNVAGNIVFRDNTAGTILSVIPCLAGAPTVMGVRGNGQLSAAANNVLTATGPATATLSGDIFGTEE